MSTELAYLIKPVRFEQDMLVSTNAVNAESAWVAGTYALGARVLYDKTPTSGYMSGIPMLRVFESLTAGNTADPTDATKWLDVGPANTVAMFSSRIADKTTATDLEVTIDVTNLVTGVAFFGLEGGTLTIVVKSELGATRSTHTTTLVDRAQITNWLDFFVAPRTYVSQVFFLDVVAIPGDTIELTITGDASCARMLWGQSVDIGMTEIGVTWEMDDYSASDPDEFGNVDPTRRDYAARNMVMIMSDKQNTNRLISTLIDVRAEPVVFIAVQDTQYVNALVNYGLVKEPAVAVDYHLKNAVTFEFKGFV